MAGTSDESATFTHLAEHPPSPDERILRALEQELASHAGEKLPGQARFYPWRLSSRQARVWVSLGSAGLVLVLGSLGAISRGMNRATASALLVAFAGGLGLCFLFLPSAAPGPTRSARSSRQMLVLLVALLTLAYAWLTIAGFDPLSAVLSAPGRAGVVRCGLHVLLSGSLCLLALLLPWRHSDPFSPRLLGGLVGALAGYASMLTIDAACASTEGFHVLLSHASAVAVFGLCGALVGRRWLSP